MENGLLSSEQIYIEIHGPAEFRFMAWLKNTNRTVLLCGFSADTGKFRDWVTGWGWGTVDQGLIFPVFTFGGKGNFSHISNFFPRITHIQSIGCWGGRNVPVPSWP
jgi:hypothetical protein